MQFSLLSAASVFSAIGSVVVAVLILLVMITVHEFGHYVAGKIFKFKINEFAIGFGPALFKHKRGYRTGLDTLVVRAVNDGCPPLGFRIQRPSESVKHPTWGVRRQR